MLWGNLTEVGPFWQVPPDETINILIRTPLPGCIGVGKIAFDAELSRELFVLGILGSVVQREGLTTIRREFLEALDDRLVGFSGPFSEEFADQHQSALAFGQRV